MTDDIQYLVHGDINKQQWNECIRQALNSLIYAKAEFLDAMSPGWDALVIDNYEAVFPVTWRKKVGARYVCQPAFTQQLGLFYKNEKYSKHLKPCLERISEAFKLVEIFINYHNTQAESEAQYQNFILPLDQSYDTIRQHYKSDLLKNLKRTEKFHLQYLSSNSTREAVQNYKQYYGSRMNIRDDDYEQFQVLAEQLLKKGDAFVREIKLPSGQLLAIALFLKDDSRIYNIASTTLPDGRTLEANHFLMDELIKEFAGTGMILDFEGSDLPGVARFYQKFSPQSQPYAFYKSNRLPKLVQWLKNRLDYYGCFAQTLQ